MAPPTVRSPTAPFLTHGPYDSAQIRRRAIYRFAKPQLIWSRGVLRQPAVAYFDPGEDPLHHQERMFNFRPDFRLGPITGPPGFTQGPMARGFPLHKTLGSGPMVSKDLALAIIGRQSLGREP